MGKSSSHYKEIVRNSECCGGKITFDRKIHERVEKHNKNCKEALLRIATGELDTVPDSPNVILFRKFIKPIHFRFISNEINLEKLSIYKAESYSFYKDN